MPSAQRGIIPAKRDGGGGHGGALRKGGTDFRPRARLCGAPARRTHDTVLPNGAGINRREMERNGPIRVDPGVTPLDSPNPPGNFRTSGGIVDSPAARRPVPLGRA